MSKLTKEQARRRRHARVRAKVRGTTERPRLAVYRSNRTIYVQVIDDANGTTLCTADSRATRARRRRRSAS
jgi:large subunit ribosomal protein L18